MSSQRPAAFLAAFLGLAGVMHFARPKFFDTMVPKELPGSPRQWTHASGVVELAVATSIALPKTRELGGLAAALMFLGVFPANVKQALDAKGKERAVAYARLPVQWPLIAWALKVRDNA